MMFKNFSKFIFVSLGIIFFLVGGVLTSSSTVSAASAPAKYAQGVTNTSKPKATPTTTNTSATPAANTTVDNEPDNGDAGGFVKCGNTAGNPCKISDLFRVFIIIINYLIGMAGFVAVIAIVYAGFMMVYSQGQEQLKVAKGRLSGAIIGLVLVAGAFVLINSLFDGRLSIGVKNGCSVLADPVNYINDVPCK